MAHVVKDVIKGQYTCCRRCNKEALDMLSKMKRRDSQHVIQGITEKNCTCCQRCRIEALDMLSKMLQRCCTSCSRCYKPKLRLLSKMLNIVCVSVGVLLYTSSVMDWESVSDSICVCISPFSFSVFGWVVVWDCSFNGYTLRGNNSSVFIFFLLLNRVNSENENFLL